MKYVVLLGDGMSDLPLPELGGKTPLMVARTPNLDRMVQCGIGGSTLNVPPHLPPGSDVCNLSVLGYDLGSGYTGRSPIEAAAMGVELADGDIAFRCNLVTLRENGTVMDDFSAGHITTDEAHEVIALIQQQLGSDAFSFYPGVSYRHLLVWHGGKEKMVTTPPHDISDREITEYLPRGDGAAELLDIMQRSQAILCSAPVNQKRIAAGKKPVSSIWLWGQGSRPSFPKFVDLYGKTGAMITAVDLMRGIANYIGFENIAVEGATGWIDTNYAGKAQACIDAFERVDLVFVHVESPDESGHAGNVQYKIQAIEDFDAKVVGPIIDHLEQKYPGAFRAMSLPDHPTPVALKTHTRDRVPFALMGAGIASDECNRYDESLEQCGSFHPQESSQLMRRLLGIL
ncbi:cofactor-independent phosphoglycerate mutase [Chrysiogenes arsenatis]|uniref:cofactor-independent phosphoglycerate mutase n=1 Tax=Chrysiogenes arsenatis TaxID=309797 RepID=UPI00040F3F08|nr:cofactor-independent phosphoglycerate mutase [Chrysiogenes arsenatis]